MIFDIVEYIIMDMDNAEWKSNKQDMQEVLILKKRKKKKSVVGQFAAVK